ncbi:hypothetical protein [Streptomyces avidinii]|uniref:CHAT domain-containing protein n=1 Tax=Streptomyces avidinii TaxID=1895 RepID=A0ABS4L1L7_STRAV|nr:hypothetical protein [Streptomyces avidinii]MBP2036173.1 hypothetical protein [Streptomyces avidinii]GGY83473.1 hypothetical protein GCM10010343_05450 [Streptomyces avidinii]
MTPGEALPAAADPTRALSLPEITYLNNVGALFRSAPGYRASQDALDTALRAAERFRAEGVAWPEITRALGIPQDELRHRLAETTRKPHPGLPAPGVPATRTHWHAPPFAGLMDQQGSSSISTPSPQSFFSPTPTPSPAYEANVITPSALTRRLLFIAGDPRPGRNNFGPEVAEIRAVLSGSYVGVTEMSSASLAEFSPALDLHAPAALHVAAHSSFGGIHLTQAGGDLCVALEAFVEQIARVRLPPRLAVLNFCHSSALAAEMARTVTTVIGWPHSLSDHEARTFTGQLYRSLVTRRSVGESCKDAEAALAGPHPDAPPPDLYGSAVTHVF